MSTQRQKDMIIPERKLPVSYQADVLVVGGGPAGIAAAISAAQNGAEVILIEQRGYLGGMGTAALVPAFCPYTDGEKPIIRGIGLMLLNQMKNSADKQYLPEYKDQLDWVPIDVEVLKRVYDKAVLENGVKLLFHTFAAEVLVEEQKIKGVVVCNKSGLSVISASVYIDATGDADLAALSGVPTQKGGEQGELQPGTMCYLLAGANRDKFNQYVIESGDTHQIPLAVEKAQKAGILPQGRKEVSGFAWITPSLVGVNFGHIFDVDGTKVEDLTRAVIEGRKLVELQVSFLKEFVPGFENVYLVHTGDQIGIRETRRIEGDYTLTAEDFLEMRSFEDDIARNAYFIDIHLANSTCKMTIQHLPKGKSHGVPYRCLLPKNITNLIVAGRSVSSDRVVQGSLRVMPNCFAMGQASGTAAAMAAKKNGDFRDISVPKLQKALVEQGAWLGEGFIP